MAVRCFRGYNWKLETGDWNMINQRIENIVNFIREARDEADCFAEHVMYFMAFLLLGAGFIALAFTICMLAFTIPKVFIPLYFSIFILWQGYKRL